MIAQFDKAAFEKALPVKRVETHAISGPSAVVETKLWKPLGIVQGEFAYLIPVREPFGIMVRSSVRADGLSASTGEDSIRCWIVNGNLQPWGSRIGRYITRVPGWEQRLLDTLRTLYKMILLIDKCKNCTQYRKIFRVRKDGPNKGKFFLKCTNCKRDDNRPPQFLEMK
jgi:hypothetical protein